MATIINSLPIFAYAKENYKHLDIEDFSLDNWATVLGDALEDANYHSFCVALPEALMEVVQSPSLKASLTERLDLYVKLCNAVYECI